MEFESIEHLLSVAEKFDSTFIPNRIRREWGLGGRKNAFKVRTDYKFWRVNSAFGYYYFIFFEDQKALIKLKDCNNVNIKNFNVINLTDFDIEAVNIMLKK